MIAALLLAASSAGCTLTQADLEANARLSFAEFDQQGTTPTTARKLGERKCYAAAVDAYRHYLLFGPVGTDGERAVMRFHLGQDLALAGRETEAANMIATARRLPIAERPEFDWNTYVVGTTAFLTKDRALLDAMATKLGESNNFGNRMNAWVLRRLQRCFDQPYRVAYGTDPRCSTAGDLPPKD